MMIKQWEGDAKKKWNPETAFLQHKELGHYGTCAFGVEARNLNGNINFHVGAGDVTRYVNYAIENFSKNGKVGASGKVDCAGNTAATQPTKWGIYHT
jgi:hypothetical protein